jgi:acyl-CoA thioesterase I
MIESVARRLAAGGRVVVAGLGDSLTYGWLVRRGFFERFCDGLEQRFRSASIERINAGVPGDTAAEGETRLEQVLARGPHLVVVQFGLNDAFQGVTPDELEATLARIARRATGTGAVPLLVTSCSLPDEETEGVMRRHYDAILRAASRTGTPAAQLDRYWLERGGTARGLHQDDGVHPTDAGHALMAEGLIEAVCGRAAAPR